MYADKNYAQLLLKGLNDLRQCGSLCDVELHVGDLVFCAHKVVLSACSRYFKAMFTGKMEESLKYRIDLHQVNPNALNDIINFAYTGNVSINQRNVQDLLATARMLHLERIVDACCEFLESNIHPCNCLGILNFSELHSCKQLWTRAFEYLEDHFLEVILFDEFLKIDVTLMEKILKSDNLNVSSEEDVINALEIWILYDAEKRMIHIADLLCDSVRIFHLDTSYIASYIVDGALSSFSQQCKKIFTEVLALKTDPRRIKDNRLETIPSCRRDANHLVVFGGKTGLFDILTCCEAYSDMIYEWDVVSTTTSKRSCASAALLNGKIYLVGGLVQSDSNTQESCDGRVEIFHPVPSKWDFAPSLKEPRYNHEAVTLNSTLYVLGGYNDQRCLKSVECYNEYSRQWQFVRPMMESRSCFAAVALDGCIYALGGFGRVQLSSVEKYDTKRDKWSLVPAMSTARNNFGACVLHGFIYAEAMMASLIFEA
ncbi:kelch-like protein 28 isoform X2 [Rhopilema esculentum]|uniref:kelch-like protein 28 isoform X2 n=1 Tax=Rhopilema esculentum TaxID=499914 RepID=UPI0031D80EC8